MYRMDKHKVLLYSTGNCIQYLAKTIIKKNVKKTITESHRCITEINTHCKLTVPQ